MIIPENLLGRKFRFASTHNDSWTVCVELDDEPCTYTANRLFPLGQMSPSLRTPQRRAVLAAIESRSRIDMDLRVDRLGRVVDSDTLTPIIIWSMYIDKTTRIRLSNRLIDIIGNIH